MVRVEACQDLFHHRGHTKDLGAAPQGRAQAVDVEQITIANLHLDAGQCLGDPFWAAGDSDGRVTRLQQLHNYVRSQEPGAADDGHFFLCHCCLLVLLVQGLHSPIRQPLRLAGVCPSKLCFARSLAHTSGGKGRCGAALPT